VDVQVGIYEHDYLPDCILQGYKGIRTEWFFRKMNPVNNEKKARIPGGTIDDSGYVGQDLYLRVKKDNYPI